MFNSVAAGALHALDEEGHGVQRVAIIDLDVHHGEIIYFCYFYFLAILTNG